MAAKTIGTAMAAAAATIAASAQAAAPAAVEKPLAPAELARAPASGEPVERAFLIGRWTDNGDCRATVELRADGTFRLSGGAGGRWTFARGRLKFVGTAAVRSARVLALGARRIVLIHDDGTIGQSQRCGAN